MAKDRVLKGRQFGQLPIRIGMAIWNGEELLEASDCPITRDIQGTRRLVSAVIIRAIQDSLGSLLRDGPVKEAHNRQIQREAMAWIEDNNMLPYSFCYCCQVLGLDPDKLRDKIERIPNRTFKLTLKGWRVTSRR